jgi:hypothetical protein
VDRDSYEAYRAGAGVNISSLLLMARSPLHYKHATTPGAEPQPDTDAMAFGRLVHLAILEPDKYRDDVAVWRGGRRAGKEWDAWQLEHAGKVHATASEAAQCEAMSLAVWSHPIAEPYLTLPGLAEVTMRWTHPMGVECKSRLDWYVPGTGTIVDLKTSRDASEFAFARSAASLKYATRAAFYWDAVRYATGATPNSYVLMVVEKAAPFAVVCYRLSDADIEHGRAEYERLLSRLNACLETDSWPGYADDRETELLLPAWTFGNEDGGVELDIGGEAFGV